MARNQIVQNRNYIESPRRPGASRSKNIGRNRYQTKSALFLSNEDYEQDSQSVRSLYDDLAALKESGIDHSAYSQHKSRLARLKKKIFNVEHGLSSGVGITVGIGKYVAPGNLVPRSLEYRGKVSYDVLPQTALDSYDYTKRLRFEELKKTRLEAMCSWKIRDHKGMRKNAYIKRQQKRNEKILSVSEKDDLEKLDVYTDRFPCLDLRKSIKKLAVIIHLVSNFIITTKVFENASIMIIILNSTAMIFDDSATNDNPNAIWSRLETFFFVAYSAEMVLKILGLGFFFADKAYLTDSWNILDFTIVMTSIPTMFASGVDAAAIPDPSVPQDYAGGAFSFTSLRVFRVLRPLKTISSIKGLRILMNALFSSIPILRDTILILLFLFMVFAIAGVQLMSGATKKQCYSVQTGQQLATRSLCNDDCPPGYYCGKSNSNPNYGSTSFDNIFYALVIVFQCTTLEGWSDDQEYLQRSFSTGIFLYFIPLMFCSAFFFLNLTLAVINAKFTEAHSAQQEADLLVESRRRTKLNQLKDDQESNEALTSADKMSIGQFITARIYAKKMIEFLRMRQEIRRIEQERFGKDGLHAHVQQKAKRAAQDVTVAIEARDISFNAVDSRLDNNNKSSEDSYAPLNLLKIQSNKSDFGNGSQQKSIGDWNGTAKAHQTVNISNIVIQEDEDEHRDDHSDREDLRKDISNFQKQTATIDTHRLGQNASDLGMNYKMIGQNKQQSVFKALQTQIPAGSAGPTMKGNIGPIKKGAFLQNEAALRDQQYLFDKMAAEFDIDNVIPKFQQVNDPSEFNMHQKNDSIASFELSIRNYDLDSYTSSKAKDAVNGGKSAALAASKMGEEESGLITSDSDFEELGHPAGYHNPVLYNNQSGESASKVSLKRDVMQTFKKLLTANYNRGGSSANKDELPQTYRSTKYDVGSAKKNSESRTAFSDIEEKFVRKKKSMQSILQSKAFKEDSLDENYLQDRFAGQALDKKVQQTKKEDIRQLHEFVSTKRPRDPFKDLDPLNQKVSVSEGKSYLSTSTPEVFSLRMVEFEKKLVLEENAYVKQPLSWQGDADHDFANQPCLRNQWAPYQQKIEYEVYSDTSGAGSSGASSISEDDYV